MFKEKCSKQCGQVKFMGTMTKWPVQKHTDYHKTQSIQTHVLPMYNLLDSNLIICQDDIKLNALSDKK